MRNQRVRSPPSPSSESSDDEQAGDYQGVTMEGQSLLIYQRLLEEIEAIHTQHEELQTHNEELVAENASLTARMNNA